VTSKEITYQILKSRKWTYGEDIEIAGGSLRRLRELREEFEIKGRRVEDGFQYRLVGRA
jgi:hypothetical protein